MITLSGDERKRGAKVKKIFTLILAAAIAASAVGCGNSETVSSSAGDVSEENKESVLEAAEDSAEGRGFKIGIFCSPVSWGEENYRTVENYIHQYGEERFILNTIPEDCDVQTMISLCTSMAEDPDCDVIIINEAVPGSVAAMNAAKAINPDILIFAINYLEEPIEVSTVADFACGKSYTDFAYSVVDAAHEKGVEVLVIGVPVDAMGTSRNVERIAACEERAAEYGITVVTTILPNETDSNSRAPLEQAAKEDVYNKLSEYGENVGFFPSSSWAYVPQLTAIIDAGEGYMIMLADPGPFTSAWNDAFGITAPEDKALDAEWTNSAIAEAVHGMNMDGHFGNWGFSFLSGFMSASIEYAMQYQAGELERDDMEAWIDLFAEVNHISEEDFTWSTYSRDGEEYDNLAQVTGKILWYGENLN